MFKIYVGNISYKTADRTLEKLFSTYGLVDEVIYVTDDQTGKPRGFAFVLMPDISQGRSAIAALNGRQVNGRALIVGEACKGRVLPKPVIKTEAVTSRPVRRGFRGVRTTSSESPRRPFRRHRS